LPAYIYQSTISPDNSGRAYSGIFVCTDSLSIIINP
jgi:hypothetical protein